MPLGYGEAIRMSAPEVLDAKPNISSEKGSLYPNTTLEKMSTTNSDAHILGYIPKNSADCGSGDPELQGLSTLRSSRTTQVIMVPETRAVGTFYIEKPVMFRTIGADLRSLGSGITLEGSFGVRLSWMARAIC